MFNLRLKMDINLRKKENLHIVFWLIKDFAWISNYKILGLVMALPTVLLSFWLTWKCRENRADLFHNTAVAFWIIANAIWMVGEFYFEDTKRYVAMPFFFVGLAFVAWYYVSAFLRKDRV